MTLRYRGLYRLAYARALLALVELAREQPRPAFSFGPLQLSSLEQQGLTVSGPDLSGVEAALSSIHGLVEVPA